MTFDRNQIISMLRSNNLHWSIQMKIVQEYASQKRFQNYNSLAFDLCVIPNFIIDLFRLIEYSNRFPSLLNIAQRQEALALINKFSQTPDKLKLEINLVTTRQKIKPKRLKKEDFKHGTPTGTSLDKRK